MGVSKVVKSNGDVVMDLTADTITAADLAYGKTAHGADGEEITGTNTYDVDSSDLTAAVGEVLATKTFAARGQVYTGTMPNRGAVTGYISDKSVPYTIPTGFHDGSGKVGIDSTEAAKIIAGNIKAGVEILGVTGDYSGEAINIQSKSATPAWTAQTILPDAGYDYLSQVSIAAIPYVEAPNAAGGITVTIG